MERGGDEAHLHAALNPELTEEASELNSLLRVEEEKARLKEKEGGGKEAGRKGGVTPRPRRRGDRRRRRAPSRRQQPPRTWISSRGASSRGGGRSWRSGRRARCSTCSRGTPTSLRWRCCSGWTPRTAPYARAGGAAVAGGGAGLGTPALAEETVGVAPAQRVLHFRRAAGLGQGERVPLGLPATDSPWSNNPRAQAAPDWHLDAARWARQRWHNPCALAAQGGTSRCSSGRRSTTARGTK